MADDIALLAPIRRNGRRDRRREEAPRLPRVFRDRLNPLEALRPEKVRRKFRFWPWQIIQILTWLGPELEPTTDRSKSVPALVKLCTTLRFYACGAYFDVVGDTMGLSEATVCVVVHEVTRALLRLIRRFVVWPAVEQYPAIKRAFHAVAGK